MMLLEVLVDFDDLHSFYDMIDCKILFFVFQLSFLLKRNNGYQKKKKCHRTGPRKDE